MKIPVVNDILREYSRNSINLRQGMSGEVANQVSIPPVVLPQIPGRIYQLFGKPIETKGMEDMLKTRENAKKMYLQIKSEVEANIAYLLKKREEDPYRSIIDQTIHGALDSPLYEVPAFEP